MATLSSGLDYLSNEIGKYLGIEGLILNYIDYQENEQPSLTIGNPSYVLLCGTPPKDKKIYIFDNDLKVLIKTAINKLSIDSINEQLLF